MCIRDRYCSSSYCYCFDFNCNAAYLGLITFWATVCKTVRPMLSLYCSQTVGRIRMPLDAEFTGGRPLPRPYCVSSPLKKGHSSPFHFSANVSCDQTAGWIKMSLGTKVGLGQAHIVLDGDPAAPMERGTAAPPPVFGPLCSGTVAHLSNC